MQAIINGLRESVRDFNDSVEDIGSREVMEMMLITQYFDTLRDLGAHGKGSTVFVPHNVRLCCCLGCCTWLNDTQ